MAPLNQSPGLVVEEMNEEVLLYRPTTHKAIHLNPMAATIWKLCDGTRTVKDLVDCLGAAFPAANSSIAHDVQEAIDQLLREGALIEQTSESAG
jgi:hypothetical protein